MSAKVYEIHNSFIHDAPGQSGITRMVSEKEYLSILQQNSALQLSHDNIINSLGIKGDGSWSKLVIEYVMGLVAENEFIREEHEQSLGPYACVSLPATKSIIDEIGEIKAQGVDEFTTKIGYKASQLSPASNVYKVLKGVVFSGVEFAANLRAGRKG